jgi:ribosomal protein L19E
MQEQSPVRQEKSVLAIMNHTGDTKILWDSDDRDEVAAARQQFDTLIGKGFIAFRTDKKGDKGEQIREFDPKAERIIMCKQLKGG